MSELLLDVSALQAVVREGGISRAKDRWALDARWTEAVADAVPVRLRKYFDWLGEPVEITEPETIVLVDRLRRAVLGGRLDKPTDRLADAQILFLVTRGELLDHPIWVTGNPDVLAFAPRRSLPCVGVRSALNGQA